jgi:branched-chain amino acid transport system substrate-binding protein
MTAPLLGWAHSARAQDKVVHVGALYPLSGPSASSGRDARAGVELALDIINGRHDLDLPLARTTGLPRLGARLEYLFVDHQGKPDLGQAEAERLITQEKVVALQGAFHSSVVATSSQVAERLGVPYLCDIGTSPSLHTRGFKWFFRTGPHDGTFAENFFAFLEDLRRTKRLDIRRIGIVTENTLYGSDVAAVDRKLAARHGYQVAVDVAYKANAPDLSAEVLKVKAAQPEVVFHAAYTSDAILLMKTYKQHDFFPRALIAHGSGFLDGAFRDNLGPDANYVISWEIWGADLGKKKALIRQVGELFRRTRGFEMNGHSARSFVGTLVLADALNRAGATDPEAVRRALLATDIPGAQMVTPWDGVRFDPTTGQNIRAKGIIVQLLDGQFHVVWPREFATAEVVWPAPGWRQRR